MIVVLAVDGNLMIEDAIVALLACLDQLTSENIKYLMFFYTRFLEGLVAYNIYRIYFILMGFMYKIMGSL